MPYAMNQSCRIYYEVEGQGPPIIFQHGATGNLADWRDLGYARELAKDYRLILVDGRGYGASDKPGGIGAYKPETIAGDYVAILKDLKIDKACYFGYSMGAAIGFKAIARYALPRFNSLILGGGNPFPPRTDAEKERIKQNAADWQNALSDSIETFVALREKQEGPMPPERRKHALANNRWSLLAFSRARLDWPAADDILPNINVPCLIYAGDKDQAYNGAKEAAAKMPKATFVSFPGFTHNDAYFKSEAVLPAIRKFLAEVNK